MTILLRTTETKACKIDDMIFHLAPLSFVTKGELTAIISEFQKTENLKLMLQAAFIAIKHSIKKVEGITLEDGTEYQVEFEDEKKKLLTDECVEDLCNLEQSTKLFHVCTAMLQNNYGVVKDPLTGKPLEGVTFLPSKKK